LPPGSWCFVSRRPEQTRSTGTITVLRSDRILGKAYRAVEGDRAVDNNFRTGGKAPVNHTRGSHTRIRAGIRISSGRLRRMMAAGDRQRIIRRTAGNIRRAIGRRILRLGPAIQAVLARAMGTRVLPIRVMDIQVLRLRDIWGTG
jgi:hypothetical protein